MQDFDQLVRIFKSGFIFNERESCKKKIMRWHTLKALAILKENPSAIPLTTPRGMRNIALLSVRRTCAVERRLRVDHG